MRISSQPVLRLQSSFTILHYAFIVNTLKTPSTYAAFPLRYKKSLCYQKFLQHICMTQIRARSHVVFLLTLFITMFELVNNEFCHRLFKNSARIWLWISRIRDESAESQSSCVPAAGGSGLRLIGVGIVRPRNDDAPFSEMMGCSADLWYPAIIQSGQPSYCSH